MKAHSSKLNGMRLPCPRCHNPASIEARVCSCGYRFVAAPSPQIKPQMPELKQVIPGFQPIVHKIPIKENDTEHSERLREGNKKLVYLRPVSERPAEIKRPDRFLEEPKADEPKPDDRYIDTVLPLSGLTTVTSQALREDRQVTVRRGLKYVVTGLVAAGIIGVVGGITAFDKNKLPSFADAPAAVFQTPIPEEHFKDLKESVSEVPLADAQQQPTDAPATDRQSLKPGKTEFDQRLSDPSSTSGDQVPNSNEPANVTTTEEVRGVGSPDNTAIAKARCVDGTYSYRESRSGVCAYRGGVAEWLGRKDGNATVNAADRPLVRSSTGEKPEVTTRKFILGARGGCYYLGPTGNKNYVDKSFCN